MLVLFVTLALVSAVVASEHPVVTLPNLGQVQGGTKQSLNGRTFYSFEGVPYAQAPIGENRFKEPVPLTPWKGVWEAKTIYKCMQYNQFTPPGQDYVIGDEDCLYLNIYTPKLDTKAKLDVIVYIHGGAFMFNWAGLQGPEYLLDKDVVLVTLNYRLGPLGFLSTEDQVVPGNNGMRDQIFALQFIKNHVKHFGGNPDSITIMGMSAGGASTHFHYLSPKSRGLFHRGWSMSGTTLEPWVLMEQPLAKTRKLATIVGCSTGKIDEMVTCLKTRPARQIVGAVKEYQPWLYTPFSPFGLVVDSWAADPVLPTHPYQIIKNKQVYDVPWIASYTNSEGLYPAADFYHDEYLQDLDERWNDLVPHLLDYNYTVERTKMDEVSQKIRKYYLGNKQVTKSTYMDFIPVVSDRIFVIGIQKTARWQAAVTKSPIYSYVFSYRGAHSWSEFCSGGSTENFGASHGDDTAYIYKYDVVKTATTDQDKKMIKFFVDLLTTYARTGKPKVGVEWPQVPKNLKDEFTFLKIDSPDKLSVGRGIAESTKFWDSLPIKENEKLFADVKDEL
ncbi:esterase 6 precursor [Tribolium castaneum]|uniref:Carboxylic ester hydrolase n=1 Tax=Tribolium castaneum TaxID=7070 RepID=D7ELD3_TRICA|nr:esterase 6 precursor [Tribolium castaneum]EFA11999.1 esterase 6 [Tribolium castaneum]|eukprot:NP_001164097.1 esterase 6 precursor [Tribolium castaneum]